MKTRFLSLRLACQNIRRNHQTYGPFLLATSLLTFALYAFHTMRFNAGLAQAEVGKVMMPFLLMLGSVVVTAFTYIFLFYANSFLIRRRKTEFGLYGVLGMERRHIVAVMFHEMLVIYLLTLMLGMGLGTLLTRLLFLILRALTQLDIPLENTPAPLASIFTLVTVSFLFLLLFLYNALQVRLAKPIDLLHARQQGEKEPKARWILSVIGLAAMIAGYVIALRVNDPLTALESFFHAVLLVILGTYLLFLTGSIALLKALKARKSFYYQPKHFINISGMMFRMKQNAAGLASIAILCTMAMVTFGSTGALYLSIEKTMNDRYPTDVRVSTDSAEAFEAVLSGIEQANEESGLTMRGLRTYRYYRASVIWDKSGMNNYRSYHASENEEDGVFYEVAFIPQEDFNAIEGTSLALGEREMAIYGQPGYRQPFEPGGSFLFNGEMWQARPIDRLTTAIDAGYSAYDQVLLIVMPDWNIMEDVAENYPAFQYQYGLDLRWCAAYDLSGSLSEQVAYESILLNAVHKNIRAAGVDMSFALSTDNRAPQAQNLYTLYGTLLFIGVFLGMIFLMGTALIIYFKQLSEGHQDRERFAILQKVGMDQTLVRRSVRQQVLLVFFLPLAVALCHVLGSLRLIALMIQLFDLTDAGFISLCTAGSALTVAAVYLAFYGQTAHTYYKLVRLEVKT
ncbi:MAG: FtsX-like permease family protein [Christensenellaceae bacterium]|nr:FtsX-like permease family protein [Christensenellaceae bacterium]